MTKKELIKALEDFDDDQPVVCTDEDGGWDNIQRVEQDGCLISVVYGREWPVSRNLND
jgi:hypothetical protein